MMDNKNTWTSLVARFFLSTAASILIITGLIKVLSLFGSAGMLAVKDPVFGISFGILMPLVGVTEIAVGSLVLFCRNGLVASVLILWMSIEFVAYRFFSAELRPGSYCPCLGSLGEFLGLSQAQATHAALLICIILLILGLLALAASIYAKKKS
ncbi:MAG: hypothetical protein ACOX2U_04070 [Limisphaerales bacterium]|nr:hypothetical protein [Verrucomicrobiota bacterium]